MEFATPTANPHKRRRIRCDFSEPQITDQSFKRSCDINFIMEQYAKTGMLPNYSGEQPIFADLTDVPDLNTVFELSQNVSAAFQDLPPIVRKAMDNNPAQIQDFIQNPENFDFLVKHKVLLPRKEKKKENALSAQDVDNLAKAINSTKKKSDEK